jgi:hypothetical protein
MGSGDLAPGDSITLPLTASLGSASLGAATIEIQYDATVLDATSCEEDPGSALDVAICNIDPAADKVGFTAISASGVPGDLVLAQVTFQAVGGAGDSSTLDVSVPTLADPDGTPIPVQAEDGLINVKEADGDVNCDGSTNAVDALFILQREVGLRPEDGQTCPPPANGLYLPACDVSGDGSCDAVDALFVLQCEVGIANDLCPAPALAMTLEQGASGPKGMSVGLSFSGGVPLGDAAVGERITVPVTAVLGEEALGAATVEIAYDPAVLQADACRADPAGAFDLAMCNVDQAGNSVVLTIVSARGVAGEPLLTEVSVQVVGEIEGGNVLTLTADPFVDGAGHSIDAYLRVR